jgi:hypothetical protein
MTLDANCVYSLHYRSACRTGVCLGGAHTFSGCRANHVLLHIIFKLTSTARAEGARLETLWRFAME